jgi:hypothetical protein
VHIGRYVCRLRRCRHDGLFGAALAGDEDANAFDHLGSRAGAFGQEDIGVESAVEGVDGAGDDHCGEAGVELLGATDQFVSVHLWHEKVA